LGESLAPAQPNAHVVDSNPTPSTGNQQDRPHLPTPPLSLTKILSVNGANTCARRRDSKTFRNASSCRAFSKDAFSPSIRREEAAADADRWSICSTYRHECAGVIGAENSLDIWLGEETAANSRIIGAADESYKKTQQNFPTNLAPQDVGQSRAPQTLKAKPAVPQLQMIRTSLKGCLPPDQSGMIHRLADQQRQARRLKRAEAMDSSMGTANAHQVIQASNDCGCGIRRRESFLSNALAYYCHRLDCVTYLGRQGWVRHDEGEHGDAWWRGPR
jgi:hypothetical protein